MNPPAQEFETLIRKTFPATGLEKLTVKVPVRVPFYRRKSLGFLSVGCSFVVMALSMFLPLLGVTSISLGYFLLGIILSSLCACFFGWLQVLGWFVDPVWEVTVSRNLTLQDYFTYSARVGDHNLFSTAQTLAGLMAEKKGVTPEGVAEAFAEALQQVSADRFQRANDRLSVGLERHRILQELDKT